MNVEMVKTMLHESPTDISTERSLKRIRRAMPVPNDFRIIGPRFSNIINILQG